MAAALALGLFASASCDTYDCHTSDAPYCDGNTLMTCSEGDFSSSWRGNDCGSERTCLVLTEGATCVHKKCIGMNDEPTCVGNTLIECDEGRLWTEMPCLSCSAFECNGGYGELCADDSECLPPLLCREKEGDILKHCLLPCTCANAELSCPACDRPEFGFKYGTQRALGFCTDGWCER